jgi:hypothetical protein
VSLKDLDKINMLTKQIEDKRKKGGAEGQASAQQMVQDLQDFVHQKSSGEKDPEDGKK